jgi:hypothetical protein
MADEVVAGHVIETLLKLQLPAVVSEHVVETIINLSIPEIVSQYAIEYVHKAINPIVLSQHVIEYIPIPIPAPQVSWTLVRRLRQAPIISDEDLLVRYDAFEVDLQAGIGNVTDPGVEPTVVLQYSDDAGETWSDEYRLSAGQMGDFVRKVKWTRLGVSRNRVFRIWCTDPCLWVIINAYLTMKKGRL